MCGKPPKMGFVSLRYHKLIFIDHRIDHKTLRGFQQVHLIPWL